MNTEGTNEPKQQPEELIKPIAKSRISALEVENPSVMSVQEPSTRTFIQRENASNQVVVYVDSAAEATAGKRLRAIFRRIPDVQVKFHDAGNNANQPQGRASILELLREMTGRPNLPCVFVNNKFMGGCKDVHVAYLNGTLATLLDKSTTNETDEADLQPEEPKERLTETTVSSFSSIESRESSSSLESSSPSVLSVEQPPAKTFIEKENASSQVVVYMDSGVSADSERKRLQAIFRRFPGVEVKFHDAGHNFNPQPHGAASTREVLREMTGRPNFPYVFVNNMFMGGCADVHVAYRNGSLQKQLALELTQSQSFWPSEIRIF